MASVPGGEVLVANEHPRLQVDSAVIERVVRHVLREEGQAFRYVGIVFDGHETVHALNRDHLDHDYETDVLSFLIEDTPVGIEGEVYVDLDTAVENAERFETTWTDEAARYAVHGVLHLCGHDDATDEQRLAMHALENRYLAACE